MDNCRECRKFSEKLFLKGDRCLGPKCALTKRQNAPGTSGAAKMGQSRRRKKSEYGIQLLEKQKAKQEYGLRERQFHNIYKKAAQARGATGEIMLQILESRFDNVIYRLGWAKSRDQARQLVNHGHFKLNNKVTDIPSLHLKVKNLIEPKKIENISKIADTKIKPPAWIKVDNKQFKAEVLRVPTRDEIETPVDEQLIVEYYSR